MHKNTKESFLLILFQQLKNNVCSVPAVLLT